MNTLAETLIVLLVALNGYASLVLVRSPYYDARQKLLQLAIIWLIPVIGALLVWALARPDAPTKPRRYDIGDIVGSDLGGYSFDDSSRDTGGHHHSSGMFDGGFGGGFDGGGGDGGGGD